MLLYCLTAMIFRTKSLFLSALLLCSAPLARAGQTIVWGNEIDSVNRSSDGSTLWGAGSWSGPVVAALGVFDAGFVPSEANAADWADNWTVFQTATYNATNGYFSGTAVLNDNTVFAAGQQAYMWIYNSQEAVHGSEWLLVTDDAADGSTADDWVFEAIPADNQQQLRPLQWDLLSQAGNGSTVIFGGLNQPDPLPFNSQIGGEWTEPTSAWCLQTHTFAAIPEPSVLFLAGAGLVLTGRRRRQG